MLFLVLSCSDEPVDNAQLNVNLENDKINATLVDGRLHFENEATFKTSINYMKSLEDENIEDIMYEFYDDGFKPLYPFYHENDDALILEFVQKKTKRMVARNSSMLKTDDNDPDAYIEPDDYLIGDDYFAGLLNFDREIVIGGKLHKYTNNGVFRVNLDKKTNLDAYILANNITELNPPNPDTIERGLVQVTPDIDRYAKLLYQDPCDTVPYDPGFGDDILSEKCFSGGGGSAPSNNNSFAAYHTENMKNYMKDLMPCDSQSGGVFGWNPFGTSRNCFSNHSDDYRTKTKYWNEDLLVYTSIGVKIKHQKKGLWWYAKTTDEIALVINQAMFAITDPNQIANYGALPTSSSNNQRLYYYNNKFYDNFAASYAIYTGWTPTSDELVPKTPFQDDIIVQEYIDLPILRNLDDIEVEASEINKLFWDKGVWTGVKTLMNRFNETPKKVTYIVTTPQKVYVNHIDLEDRRLNEKKIVNVLDYDWGGEISLKWGVDSNGNWSSNTLNWNKPLSYYKAFDFTDLTDFETLSMDFVGLTRKGNSWRGSKIVYKKTD